MSDNASGSAENPMEQPDDDLSETIETVSVTANNSDKTSSSKNLSDMPIDVVGLIIKRSDYKEQLILRQVSKSLRSLVDQQRPSCTRILFNFYKEHIRCYYNQQSVLYVSPKSDKIERWMRKEKNNGTSILIVKEDYEKIALADLEYTLKNPKLHLEILSFKTFNAFKWYSDVRDPPCLKIHRLLHKINHKISAKEYEIQWARPSKDLRILPFLKPGVLEKISVIEDFSQRPGRDQLRIFEKISRLEQWKQAKELKLAHVLRTFPLEHATHFKRFRIREGIVLDNGMIRIRDFLSQLDDFEYCKFTFPPSVRSGSLSVGLPDLPNDNIESVSHYSIPNSEYFLEYMFNKNAIEIRKKKMEKKEKRSNFGS